MSNQQISWIIRSGKMPLIIQINQLKRNRIQHYYFSQKANIQFRLGIALQYLDQLDQSILFQKKAQKIKFDILQNIFEMFPNPKSPIQIIFLCYYHKQQRQYEIIEQICCEALTKDPNYIPFLYEIAYQFYKRKKYQQALHYYEQVLTINDVSYLGLLGQGNVSFRLNDYETALIWYEEAITYHPLQKISYLKKCKILEKQEKFHQSILTYELLLIIDKNDEKIYSKRANALCMVEDFETAIYSYDKALFLTQNKIDLQLKKANALVRISKQNEAIQIIEQIIRVDQKNFKAYYEKGILLRSLSKFSEAINFFNKSISLNPDFYKAILELGLTIQKRLQQDKQKQLDTRFEIQNILECYNKVIENWPFEVQSYILKSKLLLKINQCSEAIKVINDSEEIFPDNFCLLNLKSEFNFYLVKIQLFFNKI